VNKTHLRLPAIETRQGNRALYAFSVDGKLIDDFATVSRVARDGKDLAGYQRPEQLAHIDEIRAYIESDGALLPNAIVIAFDRRVRFEPSTNGPKAPNTRSGHLVVPVDKSLPSHKRAGFIVDGQQRVAAIRNAEVRGFPVYATAFIASGIHEQLEQFILVNSTKPLPKGLIYELLPRTAGVLPLALERRRLPAVLVTLLNEEPTSPLYHSIRTATNPEGRIKDNSLLRAFERSLSDGALHRFRGTSADESHDLEGMYRLSAAFFAAVREVFPEEWELPPKRSRLTHGAGIAALGSLMDEIAHRIGERRLPQKKDFVTDLRLVAPACHWTSGRWELGSGSAVAWDDLQNTTSHIEALVKYFAVQYRRRVPAARAARGR
jgi:DGQHR domain-containing protein